jgi:cell division septation protein DedD
MAWGNGKRGGDRVLESRHLMAMFLGVVVLCGVFFTLGYVMGRTQYGGSVQASGSSFMRPTAIPPSSAKAKGADAATANTSDGASDSGAAAATNPPAAEWDFYSKKDDNHLEPAPKPAAGSGAAVSASGASGARANAATTKTVSEPVAKPPARYAPPHMLKGSVVLQLAALKREGDALAMADAIQAKKFPAFVVTPTSDNLYRVQVGPYRDERAATAAQAELARAGFKAIVKR